MIREAIYLNCFGGPQEYNCNFSFPDSLSGDEEDEMLKKSINKIRQILGIDEILSV